MLKYENVNTNLKNDDERTIRWIGLGKATRRLRSGARVGFSRKGRLRRLFGGDWHTMQGI